MDTEDICRRIMMSAHDKAYFAVWDYFAIPKWHVAGERMEYSFAATHLQNLNYRRPPGINISELLEEITGF